jgi:GH18 family chitinase
MTRPFYSRLIQSLMLVCILCGCNMAKTNNPSLDKNPTEPASFRVIGYVTDAAVPAVIPYDKLTHINYAFLIPNEDGSFAQLNTWMPGELVRLAHAQNVKVLISVGGWGWDQQFTSLAAHPATRTAFVHNLIGIVEQNKFDGADIDWEFPDPGKVSEDYLLLLQELRAALPKNKLLTAAVAALGQNASVIPTETFILLDFVNIMAYDNSGPQHSSMDFAGSALDYWLGRGLPSGKAVLGVPFYAQPADVSYSRIVKVDPAAAQVDEFNYAGMSINYNGIPTIQAKTRLAMERGSGIMFWTLESDASGDLSLLKAIDQVVREGR